MTMRFEKVTERLSAPVQRSGHRDDGKPFNVAVPHMATVRIWQAVHGGYSWVIAYEPGIPSWSESEKAAHVGYSASYRRAEHTRSRISFIGSFAGDIGVAYQSGASLTRVSTFAPTGYATSGSPAQGQYYVQNGVYYFSPADINQTILISYNYAATASFVPNTTPIYGQTIRVGNGPWDSFAAAEEACKRTWRLIRNAA